MGTDQGELSGMSALVTGGSRGLGRGIALELAARGVLVAINYSANRVAALDTLREIEQRGGRGFLLQETLGSCESAQRLAGTLDAELAARAGDTGLDILVNNAGGGVMAPIAATTPEILEKTIADNLTGPFYVTQALLPRIRAHGRIINLSSTAARKAYANYIAYAMAKSAVDTFTVALSKELGHRGITVNSIMPGLIASESNADILADPARISAAIENIALKRVGQIDDIAGVVIALVSQSMGYVTGQVIEVSGGS